MKKVTVKILFASINIITSIFSCAFAGILPSYSLNGLLYQVTITNSVHPYGKDNPSTTLYATVYYRNGTKLLLCYKHKIVPAYEKGHSYPFACPGPIAQVIVSPSGDYIGDLNIASFQFPPNDYDVALAIQQDKAPVFDPIGKLQTPGTIKAKFVGYSAPALNFEP